MIKINLLPPNLFEGKVLRNIGIVFGVLAILIAVGLFMWKGQIETQTAEIKAQADTAENLTNQAKQINGNAASQRAGIAPITEKVKFFDSVYKHNDAYVEVYGELSRWTYRRVAYSSVTLTPEGTMTLAANAPNMRDVGRYLLNMYGATTLFQSVVLSGAPSLNAGGTSGQGGLPSAVAPMPTGMGMGAPNGATGTSLPGMAQGSAPTTASAGMGAISLNTANRAAAAKRRFTFNMSCTLTPDWKTKLTPPTPPGGGGAAAGGPGGMPGAMPGARPGG